MRCDDEPVDEIACIDHPSVHLRFWPYDPLSTSTAPPVDRPVRVDTSNRPTALSLADHCLLGNQLLSAWPSTSIQLGLGLAVRFNSVPATD
jgi:hypothetical protein